MNHDTFTQAYIEAALWSSIAYGTPEEDEADPNHEGHFDTSFECLDYELSAEARNRMAADCASFQEDNAALLEKWYNECGESPDQAGQDFWLTRNHHGAGFWYRWIGGTPQGKIGQQLTKAAHAYGDETLMYSDGEIIIE
jgi:hypothetical protein